MFGQPQRRYPKNWKEMSVELRLMFAYHICMMVLLIAGGAFTVRQEILITAVVAAILFSISLRHRRLTRWRWPGIGRRDALSALGGVVFISFFLYSATPLFPPSDRRALPWYLAGLGIGVFGILASLNLVCSSEADFLAQCRTVDQYGREIEPVPQKPEPKPSEPDWKRVVRGVYTVAFIVIWIAGVASFYCFGTSFKSGAPQPTTTKTEPLTDHGKTVYVTRSEKKRIDRLQMISWIGIPCVLVGGVVLHFLIGVKLFPNTPTMAEYWNRKSRASGAPPQR